MSGPSGDVENRGLRLPGPSGDIENLGRRPRFTISPEDLPNVNAWRSMFDPYIGIPESTTFPYLNCLSVGLIQIRFTGAMAVTEV